jgi:DNA-binding transcriptional regulator YiaG
MPPASRRPRDLFEVARLLVRSGVPVRAAKKVTDDLAAGRTAYVEAPAVSAYHLLKRQMSAQNVALHRIAPRPVDVKALRARLGLSQEAFAGRYGLHVATLRNWEQGRTTPEGPAATLLQLIDRDPDKIVELLAE